MDFLKSMAIAASGLRAQSGRMRVISENIANAEFDRAAPGGDPYRRKIPTFRSEIDRALEAQHVAMGKVRQDPTRLPHQIRAGHPAADAQRLREISERQFAGRDDRHARGAAVLRGQPQRHRRDAPHDPAHHRSPARLSDVRTREQTRRPHGVADFRRQRLRQACAARRSGRQSRQGRRRRFGRAELRRDGQGRDRLGGRGRQEVRRRRRRRWRPARPISSMW